MSRADWRTPGAYEELAVARRAWLRLGISSPQSGLPAGSQEARTSRPPGRAESSRGGCVRPALGGAISRAPTETSSPASVLWTAHALPSVIALTGLPADLADPRIQLPPAALDSSSQPMAPEHLVEHRGAVFRVHIDEDRRRTARRPPAARPVVRDPCHRRRPALARLDRPQSRSQSRRPVEGSPRPPHPRLARARRTARGRQLPRNRRRPVRRCRRLRARLEKPRPA